MIEEDLENRDWEAAQEKIFQFMQDNKRVFKNMFKIEGQDSFFRFLYAHNLKSLRENYMKIKKIENLTVCEIYMMEFYISGTVHLIEQWITKDTELSPNEMAKLILSGMPDILRNVLMNT